MNSTHSETSASGTPAAALQLPIRTSPTSFTRLFLEHTKICEQAGYDRRAITGHIWQSRRFLKALNWSENSDPARIASSADFDQAAERACAAVDFKPKSSSARSLRSGMNRVRATFLLRQESEIRSPESFSNFWSAYQYYGKIAAGFGHLGFIPGTQRRPRKPNGHFLRNQGIREGTVTALRRGIACTLTEPLKERVLQIEKLLRTPPGALTRHITFRGGPEPEQERATGHSSRYCQAVRFRYGIVVERWPKLLQDELKLFLKGKMGGKWTVRSDGYCGAADNIIKKLEAFVGWLCFPKASSGCARTIPAASSARNTRLFSR